MRRTFLTAALIGATSLWVLAQPAALPPTFEVASVKPHQGPIPRGGGRLTISGPRLTIPDYTAAGLLAFAYNVKSYQISNRASLDPTFYDVIGQARDGSTPTRDEFRLMMQSLLAQRFKLKVRREMVETPVYALVVGKSGSKLKESAPDASDTSRIEVSGPNTVWICPKDTTERLAVRITNSAGLDRLVVDKTGLTGTYDVRLSFTPENRMGQRGDPSAEISIFDAVTRQLGLKLEPRKDMVEMLFVDHIEKPSEN